MTTATEWNLKRITEKVNNVEAKFYQLYDGTLILDSNLFNHLRAEIKEIKGRIGDLTTDLYLQERDEYK